MTWETSAEEMDWDGDATHECFKPEGHEDGIHACADHLCWPFAGTPSRAA